MSNRLDCGQPGTYFSTVARLSERHSRVVGLLSGWLVEQNAKKAPALADYAYVLDRRPIIWEGPGQELRHDSAIVQAYLGGQ